MRMRLVAALLLVAGLAAGLGAGVTGTTHASGPARPGKPWNEIFLPFGHGTGTTVCVDAPGGGAPGARLRLYRCHGYAPDGAAQRWAFSCAGRSGCAAGRRFYEISNPDSGLCIGFPGGGAPVSGARLVRARCDQAPAWQLVPQSTDGTDPRVALETSGAGGPALCMAAADLSHGGMTPLVALPCDGFQDAGQILELG